MPVAAWPRLWPVQSISAHGTLAWPSSFWPFSFGPLIVWLAVVISVALYNFIISFTRNRLWRFRGAAFDGRLPVR